MSKIKITPLYERLSRDDELQSESNSIIHQKTMLEDFARRNNLPNPTHFTDDGISGTRFDRPGFMSMMAEVEAGNVGCIVVKDSCGIIGPNQKDPKMLGLSGLVPSFLTEKRTIKTTVVIQIEHRPLYGNGGR